MNVLSLFDGMSCGRLALERAGFPITNYYASEIDKYAIQVARDNFPDTVHLGDVTQVVAANFPKIDLLLGGSPCQGFSFAGGQLAFDDPRSKLFFEFVRLLKELKPRWFFLENVPMKQEFQDVISEHLGVKPVRLNSNIVSAQNRDRLYWTNIPVKSFPENKRIYLKDILQDVAEIGEEHYHSMKSVAYMERGNDKWKQAGSRRADGYEQTPETEKSFTLTANMHKGVPYNYFKETRQMSFDFHEPETKSGLIMAGQADLKGHDYNRRVYHPDGKAPTLAANSGGNLEPKIMQVPRGKNQGGIKANDGKVPTISTSAWEQNNVVTDGLRWRKLTPIECERLQTVPDNYTKCVSNTQRYRMLGNGWTVDIICHLLEGMKDAVSK
jgi:DNA-cytosine methyltransferase